MYAHVPSLSHTLPSLDNHKHVSLSFYLPPSILFPSPPFLDLFSCIIHSSFSRPFSSEAFRQSVFGCIENYWRFKTRLSLQDT